MNELYKRSLTPLEQHVDTGYPRGGKREEGIESTQRIDENFPNIQEELDPRIQVADRTLNYLNTRTPSPRNIKTIKSY